MYYNFQILDIVHVHFTLKLGSAHNTHIEHASSMSIQVHRLCNSVCVEDPMRTPNAQQLDSMTLQSYMDKNIWTTRKHLAFS